MNNIQTITLDLDDTLWEIHPVIRKAETTLYHWLGDNYPRITEQFSREAMRSVRSDVLAEHTDKSHDLTFLRKTVLSRVAAQAGYADDFIDDAFQVFDEVRNSVDIFPEVLPALELLASRFRMIAVTNGNANLEKIGIDRFFDDTVTAARAGAAKPARQMFDLAVQVGGASASETLHVGDHPHYDVDGARLAGLRTVWVNRTDSDWPDDYSKPDIEVIHIGELAEQLCGA